MSLAFRSGQPARVLWLVAFAVAAGCAGVTPAAPPPARAAAGRGDAGGGTTGGGGGPPAAPETTAGVDRPMIVIDAAADGGCTSTVTCTPPNGRYCGVIGNGCFGTIDCGACPTGQMCEGGHLRGRCELHAARLPAGDRQVLRHASATAAAARWTAAAAPPTRRAARSGPVRGDRAACR